MLQTVKRIDYVLFNVQYCGIGLVLLHFFDVTLFGTVLPTVPGKIKDNILVLIGILLVHA